jgi:hypothetical protein
MSTEKSHGVNMAPTWDLVIEESARQLQEAESRSARLRVCLDYFQKRKESGDPFPGIEMLRKKGLIPRADV